MFNLLKLKNLKNENLELKLKIKDLRNENNLLTGKVYRLTNYCEELQDIIMAQERKMKEGENNV